MRILFVSQICPWPLRNGTRQRVFYLLQGLAARHDLTAVVPVLSAEDDAAVAAIAQVCRQVIPVRLGEDYGANRRRFHEWAPLGTRLRQLLFRPEPLFVMQQKSAAMAAALARLQHETAFDAVWVERASHAAMVRQAGFTRFVTDLDALEAVSMRRQLAVAGFYWSKVVHQAEAWKTWRYERRLAGLNGPVVVCKDEDRQLFGARAADVVVVPNCVPELPMVNPAKAIPGRMLFVGDMQYEPNVDAVMHFVRDILPAIRERVPPAHLVVVGRGHSPEIAAVADNASVRYDGEVADLDSYFDTAALFVVPMRRGGGTRLKVLEALGRGSAVVSTSVGAEGLDVETGVDLAIADRNEEFAECCADLLSGPERRLRLGTSGRQRVRAFYSWNTAVDAAEMVLLSSLPAR